jgi:hypothetical protein
MYMIQTVIPIDILFRCYISTVLEEQMLENAVDITEKVLNCQCSIFIHQKINGFTVATSVN